MALPVIKAARISRPRAAILLGLLCLAIAVAGCGPLGGSEAPEPTFTPRSATATPVSFSAANGNGPNLDATVTAIVAGVEDNRPSAVNTGPEVHIDVTKHHTISPLIYGVADSNAGDEDVLKWLGATLVRWGGNARSRHNWEINASNAGHDWEFRNVSQGDDVPGSASLNFLQRNLRLGAQSILTIPTIGWVAKDGDNSTRSLNVPEHGGPPVEKGADTAFTVFKDDVWSKPYDPTANRARTSVQSFASKGAPFIYPPDPSDGKVYQDEWVAYLHETLSNTTATQPIIYAMDNEPELWSDSTHVDIRPTRSGYDQVLSNFLEYARAVKKADPTGLVIGPESWGVTGYLFSALDEGGDKFATAADRKAHGGVPWLQWFLKSVKDSDTKAGARSLDVLTVHYYPTAGQYEGGNDPTMQDKRMQAPRALWDGLYVEPSWVASTEWANLGLVRRLQRLIEQYYPGTKLGITEWNYGGENDISGAIATADALGSYGRENVYLASYWGLPKQGSPTGLAFRIFRNYDGKGSTFGTESVETTFDNAKLLSAYSALSSDGTKLTVLLLNKGRDKSTEITLFPSGFTPQTQAALYRLSGSKPAEITSEPFTVTDPAHIKLTLPPLSVTLAVFDK